MREIHSSAVVETTNIGAQVHIGPHCVVGADVSLGDRVHLHPNVVITGDVRIGEGTEVFPGAVLGKAPARMGVLSRPPSPGGATVVGEGCSIGCYAVIYEDVVVGEGTLLGDYASLREHVRVGAGCIVGRLVSVHPDVVIGEGCRILDHAHIASGTQLGARCFVSVHVSMASDNALGRLPYDSGRVAGPTLGEGVAIGVAAVLLPGVVVGEFSTIAAGAVVTRDAPASTNLRGIPARSYVPTAEIDEVAAPSDVELGAE